MAVSLECNQVFRTSLAVMEDNEHGGFGHIVHDTVVLLNGDGAFGRRHDHALCSGGEIPRQHSTEVHALLPVWIRPGVGVLGRVTSIDSKVCAIAVTSSVLSCVTPVEAVFVDVVHGVVGGAVEEASLIFLVFVSLLHVTLLDL